GKVHSELKEHEKAIADFSIYIKRNPDNPAAYVARGKARHANSDLEGAITDLSEAIRLAPNDGFSFYARGLFYGEKSDFVNAKKDLLEALLLNPESKETVQPWLKMAEEELSKAEPAKP
ncbi:MAG: tetratricopeptide repeat protein, partial [Candidatus Omnitrophica bacterium]|nr:tetratricopeptide repeat protein [Candidatus Omnitrophota bacterium]